MPAGNLRAWIDGTRERLRWIDFTAYAHRVFAAGTDRWLVDPNVFTGGIGQAQGVVGTEVLSIDVLAPYLGTLEPDTDAPAAAVAAMFGQAAPSAFIGEVIDALAHSLGARVDLVLKIPGPADLLRAAGLDGEAGFDDLDDTAIALANVLRGFSARPVSGILITASQDLSADEAEALESVVSAAKHYDWRVCVSFDGTSGPAGEGPPIGADIALYPDCSFAALEGADAAGGGLNHAFWSGAVAVPDEPRLLAHGIIPPDAQPETVVKCATWLQRG